MKWFKFYGQDYLSDPKILALSASERSCWITLLSYGSVNDNGLITFLGEEQLMAQSGISPMHEEWDSTKGVLEKLKKLKMIEFDNEMITLLNWQKRQETNLTGYERIKRYRKKKQCDNANDNAKITLDKNRIDKIRIDKDNISLPDKSDKVWDFNKFLDEMDNHKRRDFQIMAFYWKKKKVVFTNREQANSEIKRLLRAAKELTPFEDEKITYTMNWLNKNVDFAWKLETVRKFITEDLDKLKPFKK